MTEQLPLYSFLIGTDRGKECMTVEIAPPALISYT